MQKAHWLGLLVGGFVMAIIGCGSDNGATNDDGNPSSRGGTRTSSTDAGRDSATPGESLTDASTADHPDASKTPDPTNDPNNCGAVGHGCLGGACTGGVCQPRTLRATAGSFAVEGTLLYWVDQTSSNVFVGPIDDPSQDRLLAAASCFGPHMVLTPTKVVIQCASSATFVVVPKTGGAPVTIATTPDVYLTPIAATDDRIFYSSTSGPMQAISTGGGSPTDFGPNGVYPMALDGPDLFVVGGYDMSGVGDPMYRQPASGGTPTKLADVPFTAELAVTATKVIGTTTSGASVACSDTQTVVYSVPKAGGTMQPLATLTATNSRELVADDTAAYFTNYCGWSIQEVPLTGGAPKIVVPAIASSTIEIRALGLDSNAVYALESTGKLFRVAR